MIHQTGERTVTVREWAVDATDAIDLLKKLPALLLDVRTAKGLSLREVARQSGVSNPSLSHIERGVGDPSMRNAVALLRWLTKVTAP